VWALALFSRCRHRHRFHAALLYTAVEVARKRETMLMRLIARRTQHRRRQNHETGAEAGAESHPARLLSAMRAILVSILVFASASAVDLRAGCHDYASCQQFVEDVYDAAAHWGVNRNVLSDALRTLVDARPANAWGLSDIDKQWCPNNSYYDFIPVHVATLMPNGAAVSWNASCFQVRCG
jgi:hypothetical protein